MALESWSAFEYNIPEFPNEFGIVPNEPNIDHPPFITVNGNRGNQAWVGWVYNDPYMPSYGVKISAVIANTGHDWADDGSGNDGAGIVIGVVPQLYSGTITDPSSLYALCMGWDSYGGGRWISHYLREGATRDLFLNTDGMGGLSRTGIPFDGETMETQIEVCYMIQPGYKDLSTYGGNTALPLGVWSRRNLGSSASTPGSAGWEDWDDWYDPDQTSYFSTLQTHGFGNGLYPFIGIIAGGWVDVADPANAIISDVTVEYIK